MLTAARRGKPGYWQIYRGALSARDRPTTVGFPPFTNDRPHQERFVWVTTPTLELVVSANGYRLGDGRFGGEMPLAGWWWPDTCQGLRPWYERLRDARAALAPAGPAYDAVKMVYKAGIGRLGSTRRTREDDPLYQPTWRHMVIAEARGRIWRRIAKCNRPPVAVQVDGAWWFSDIEDPLAAADELGLPLDPIALGRWKYVGTGSGRDARKALTAQSPIMALRGVKCG